jgi:uncharacterized protein YbjQ (UPF0145 family)
MENLIILLVLISLGYVFGKLSERNHYKSIIEREKKLLALPTTSSKYPIGEAININDSHLVQGNVVISVDYFKRMLAGLHNFFGGTVQSYETLLDRARREAILRLKESCPQADQIINLRLETSSIYKGGKNSIGAVEILAYGTAIYLKLGNDV